MTGHGHAHRVAVSQEMQRHLGVPPNKDKKKVPSSPSVVTDGKIPPLKIDTPAGGKSNPDDQAVAKRQQGTKDLNSAPQDPERAKSSRIFCGNE